VSVRITIELYSRSYHRSYCRPSKFGGKISRREDCSLAPDEGPSFWTRRVGPRLHNFRVAELAGPLAACSPALRLGLALEMEIERYCSADEILQCRLIDLFAFVDINGAPDVPFEAGVE
jgi:hypothetical protein